MTKYFYSIPFSIGSQLQPLVHLAFGIKHDLPEIITQALAYYASSYIDVSNILSYCQDYTANNQIIVAPNDRLADTMLFNLVQADQRFDGKIEGNNTFQSAVKLLLKSKSDLIKTYMLTWSSSVQNPKQRLNALIQTATTLSKMASRQQHDTAHVDLDWFLAGGQLMDAALAIQSLIMNDDQLENWVNLLFLTMLCTFVVQGRPAVMIHSECVNKRGWDACISQVVQTSFDDPKLILALSSILRARHYGDLGPTCLEIANTLASFAEDGTWIKAGLGWSN